MQRPEEIINASRTLRLLKSGKQEITIDADAPKPQAPARIDMPEKPTTQTCPHCKQECGGSLHGWIKEDAYSAQTGWKNKLIPCPTCSGDAQILRAALQREEMLKRLFGSAQMPFQARFWEFATYPADADQGALDAVQQFVTRHLDGSDEYSKRGLYLGGGTGRCKTSLAISALKAAMRAGQSGLFIMSMELMDKLRSTFGKDKAFSEDTMLTAVTSVPWLILDDLAVERPTPYVIEKLYYVIEKRRSQGLYTIITSNLSTSDLEQYWRPDGVPEGGFHPGTRVVERIREYCEGVVVRGRNMRGGNW